jgi:hypothetical protein
LPWFSRVARAWLAAERRGPLGAAKSLGAWLQLYCCTAPDWDGFNRGVDPSWAAKLFSINRRST